MAAKYKPKSAKTKPAKPTKIKKAKHQDRPVWSGNITFGLINIPVMIYSLASHTDVHFHMLDNRNLAKIRYERINESTGKEVPWKNTVKGFEYDKDSFIILDKKELEHASTEHSKNLEIKHFIDANEIDIPYFDKPYCLLPTEKGTKGYVLLREVMRNSNKIAIGTITIHSREHLTALLVSENAIIANLIRFKQELRSLNDFDFPKGKLESYKITKKEVEVAKKLLDFMTAPWNPSEFHDAYQETLEKIIKKKIKLKKTVKPKKKIVKNISADKKAENVIDFTSLLKKSLQSKSRKKA